jgi:hypothetical protein
MTIADFHQARNGTMDCGGETASIAQATSGRRRAQRGIAGCRKWVEPPGQRGRDG